MGLSDPAKAGVTLFLGTAQYGIFLIVAEALSPSYSVSANAISDLGKVFPSSAPVFNTSVSLLGVLVIVTAYFLHKSFRWRLASAFVTLAGIGALGVGLFPEGSPFGLHGVFSLVTFLFIGLSAIAASRWQKAPLSYFSAIMGAATLVMLVLYIPNDGSYGNTIGIGPGGLERMIVYPVLVWSLAFAGYLVGMEGSPEPKVVA